MPSRDAERGRSGLAAFWTSLPGVLTGAAAVIGAVATLVALFAGDGDAGDPGRSAADSPIATESAASPAAADATVIPSAAAAAGCFATYLAGIPATRIDTVEAGTGDFDVLAANEPKEGTIGLALTDGGAPIGGIRIAFFPVNDLFKIESVVDAGCRRIAGHENVSRGGDPNVLQNWDTVRLPLGGRLYDLRIGEHTTVRLSFQAYAP